MVFTYAGQHQPQLVKALRRSVVEEADLDQDRLSSKARRSRSSGTKNWVKTSLSASAAAPSSTLRIGLLSGWHFGYLRALVKNSTQ